MLSRCSALARLAAVLVLAGAIAGCENTETGEARTAPPPSPILLPFDEATVQPTIPPTVIPTPTVFRLGPLIDPALDLRAPPVDVPLELQIPSLRVSAPVLGVGLTADNVMDSPRGPIGDPVWHTAFWYRGGGIPGDVGTATIAGHVNDPLGGPEIFAGLEKLIPGDLIIVHLKNTNMSIRFIVNRIEVYSLKESSDPVVLTQIYGAGPVAGTAPQPAPDGLSHLTLITCAGYIVDGQFDHHTVVFATRSE